MREKKRGGLLRNLLVPGVMVLAVLCLLLAVSNLQTGESGRGRGQLEDSIRRAAVTCYAAEGIYPPTLTYLEDHYGVQVDTRRYTVYYNVFGSNLMPDITVLENGD